MTILFNETDHPRRTDGAFATKLHGTPEVGLTYPELPSFEPMFFHDRVGVSTDLVEVDASHLTASEQVLLRNATQSVNDSYALEHGLYESGRVATHVESRVFRDNGQLVVDVQHLDPSTSPYGSLIAFNSDGSLAGIHDNVSDEFGERWVKNAGLRAQLFADLTEASDDGSLGEQL